MIVSLKVLVPALVGVLTGLVVYGVGTIAHDPDLRLVGFTTLLAALGHGGFGYAVPHVKKSKR